ncbi:MAG TPA: tetratricopeptide repeat protein [Acidobacteriota bacterium]|nr:tetratricopeptide repeat protein [Acidobacteriota bacterium]
MPYTGAVNGAPNPAATAASRNDRSALATAAAVFLIGAFILYWPALQAPFLFDDLYLVFDNRPILSLGNLPAMLHHNRPLVILSYAINYAWGGYAPLGYHAVQVALHGLNAWLVAMVFLVLARRWGGAAGAAPATLWWALGAGAVFLANPLLSMAVVLVSARSELLCAGFYLLGLILYLRQRDRPAGIGWLGVTAAYLAAGLSKEMAVTFPAVCLLIALLDGRTLRQTWREEKKLWLALAVVTAALLLKVLQFDWGETVGGGGLPFTRWEYFLTQVTLVARQVGVFLLPLPAWLCADPDYPAVRSLLDPRLLASLVFWAAALAGLVWACRRRRRLVVLAGVMYPLAGAPTSSIIPIADPLMEYRIYVPAVFLALLIAGLAWPADAALRGDRRDRWWTAAGAVVLGLLVLGFAGLLQARLPAYRSPLAFWSDTAAKAPDKPRPNYNLAVVQMRQGRLEKAVAGFRRVLALEPGNTDALLQLGDIARDRGDYAAAQGLYEQVLRRQPKSGVVANRMAYLAIQTGRYDEAFALLAQFPQVSKDAGYYLNLAIYFSRTGQLDRAAAMYRQVLELEPHNPVAWTNLGNVYQRSGRPTQAGECYRRALSLEPNYHLAHFNLALLCARLGELDRAQASLRTVLALNPGFAAAELELGNVLASGRRYIQAEGHYRRFLERQPNHAEGWRRLGLVLDELGRTDEAAQCRKRAERLDGPSPAR